MPPEILTVAPVSQAPVTTWDPLFVKLPFAGVTIVGAAGKVISKVKLMFVAAEVFKAKSVWVALIALTPSAAVNVIALEYAEVTQVAVKGDPVKSPLMFMVAPVSQAPVTVCAVVFVNDPFTGVAIVGTAGAKVS